MYVIVIGCGRMGGMLAMELSNEGHDVVIIDQEREKLDALGSGFNGIRSLGVEFDTDVLLEAGIEQADVFYAMTSNDNINLVAAQIASQVFHVKQVLARVNEPSKQFLYDQLGIRSVCPTSLAVVMSRAMVEKNMKSLGNKSY